jgi:hypothetical protein
VQFFKSRAFFRARLVIYGCLLAYFGHQALQAYEARQGALDRANMSDPSMPVPGVKRTATLPNGETIEYMEYELTPEQAAAMDMKVPPKEDAAHAPHAPDRAAGPTPSAPANPTILPNPTESP